MFEHGGENAQEPRDSGIGRDRVVKRQCNSQSSYARQYVRDMSESAEASAFRPVEIGQPSMVSEHAKALVDRRENLCS